MTISIAHRIAIVGSRDYPDSQHVRDFVNSLPVTTIIVSGGAKGVDSVAECAAKERGMHTIIHYVDKRGLPQYGTAKARSEYGKRAYARNHFIVQDCDELVAFQHKNSKGTQHSIDFARKANKPVKIFDSD